MMMIRKMEIVKKQKQVNKDGWKYLKKHAGAVIDRK